MVAPTVEHDAFAAERRPERGDRRPVDVRRRPQAEPRHRHQRAGIAGRDREIGLALLHRLDRAPHARAPAAVAERLARLLVHPDGDIAVLEDRSRRDLRIARGSGDDRLRRRRDGSAGPGRRISAMSAPGITRLAPSSPPMTSSEAVTVAAIQSLSRSVHRPSPRQALCAAAERRPYRFPSPEQRGRRRIWPAGRSGLPSPERREHGERRVAVIAGVNKRRPAVPRPAPADKGRSPGRNARDRAADIDASVRNSLGQIGASRVDPDLARRASLRRRHRRPAGTKRASKGSSICASTGSRLTTQALDEIGAPTRPSTHRPAPPAAGDSLEFGGEGAHVDEGRARRRSACVRRVGNDGLVDMPLGGIDATSIQPCRVGCSWLAQFLASFAENPPGFGQVVRPANARSSSPGETRSAASI